MNKIKELKRVAVKVIEVLTKKQRRRSVGAFCAMVATSIFELLGISMIVPFIMAIMDADELMAKPIVSNFCDSLGIENSKVVILLLGLLVILTYFIKGLLLLYSRFIQTKYCRNITKEMNITMLSAYLARPYEFFVNANSSEIIRGVEADVTSLFCIINVLFSLTAEALTVCLIVCFIFSTDIITAASVVGISAVVTAVTLYGSKKLLGSVGEARRIADADKSKALLQIVGGVKDIYVTQRKKRFLDAYDEANDRNKSALLRSEVVNLIPERIIEFFIVLGILSVVMIRVLGGYDTKEYIPQLAALAVACFRLLPSLNKISNAYNQIIVNYPGMDNVHKNIVEAREILDKARRLQVNEEDIFEFSSSIVLSNVEWKYQNSTQSVLRDLNIYIEKGESVALIGKSGAGKTTVADVILGLLKPQNGSVEADGIDIFSMPMQWAKHIGYVPQSVFLIDDTIRNNVAFGYGDTIDDNEIWRALSEAQLDEFVRGLPEGLDTIVGERGIKFSGGQRQRIAIARVMYYNPEILILDEATSALDDDTEKAVMDAINSLQGRKTLIIIAHRLSTIKNCDKIYEIGDGKAVIKTKEEVFVEE